MTPNEKIKYVKDAIYNKAQISPSGPIYLRFYTVSEYEDGPTLLSRGEQKLIVKKLEEQGYIQGVVFDEDGSGVKLEVNEDSEISEKATLIFPKDLAQLWILWNEAISVVKAYEENPSLDRKELDKLYLELIGAIESVISKNKVGNIKEIYKRPFTSLATAEVETRAKNTKPIVLMHEFLIEITALEPDPIEIGKAVEKNSEIISRITYATKAISGEKIDFSKLSYEQALFMLKIVFSNIFRIIETVSTGYMNMIDENLNAKYIPLLDTFNDLLSRDDFREVKKRVPEDLPAHLFEGADEMDMWWEHGGQSAMMTFTGDIEVAWIRAGKQTFPVVGWLIQFFNETDAIIKTHRKDKTTRWDNMMKDIDRRKEAGEFSFNQSPTPQKQEPTKIEITTLPELIIKDIRAGDQKPLIKLNLKDSRISFDDAQPAIIVGSKICSLPPHKNEHFLSRAMFSYKANEFVDWSVIYKQMSGVDLKTESEKEMRSVRDTMYALNSRIREVFNTDDALFSWENKSLKRNF